MAKLSDNKRKKVPRKERVAELKAKKVSGEKLTWRERCELHWVAGVMISVFVGWTILGILVILEATKVIDIF